MNHFPLFLHQFIEDVVSVGDDGHCGFRVVYNLLGWSFDSYSITCLDLTLELNSNP